MTDKVLLMTRQYPPIVGGVEIVVEQHARFYRDKGYEVRVVTMDPNAEGKVFRYGRHGESIVTWPVWRSIQSVHISAFYIWDVIKSWIFDGPWTAIEIQYPSPLDAFLVTLCAMLYRQKIIVTFHAPIVGKNWLLTKLARIFEHRLFEVSSTIIFTSSAMSDRFASRHGGCSKARVCAIASEIEVPSVVLPRPRKSARLNLLFVGRLVPYKGLEVLLKSIVGLDNVRITIFGDGPLKGALQKLGQELGLTADVLAFHPQTSEQDKHELLLNNDVLVLPSVSDAEAFGIVQVEAMGFGLAVINTNLATGVPEVSIHSLTGLTVLSGSVSDLRAAICSLRDDDETLLIYKTNAIERAKKFSLDAVSDSFSEII